jgi:hypothetical protein
MEYFCNLCNYSTTDRGNFYHHKKTQKHISNTNVYENIQKANLDNVINNLNNTNIKNSNIDTKNIYDAPVMTQPEHTTVIKNNSHNSSHYHPH